jgi:hypothetical protein
MGVSILWRVGMFPKRAPLLKNLVQYRGIQPYAYRRHSPQSQYIALSTGKTLDVEGSTAEAIPSEKIGTYCVNAYLWLHY